MANLPQVASERKIDPATWSALCDSIFPGAKPESVAMAWDYCKARKLDVLLKPVHLVPMNVKDPKTGQSDWRDVVMPGIGLYRIQAEQAGSYAGADAPEFGPVVEMTFEKTNKWNNQVEKVRVAFPEWCKYTVHKLIGDRLVSFSATEYWIENYATASAKTDCPNAMWQKRPRAQLAKCAEAQALRRAWPSVSQDTTAEEMEGKEIYMGTADVVTQSADILAHAGQSAAQPKTEDSAGEKHFSTALSMVAGVQSIPDADAMAERVRQGKKLTADQTEKVLAALEERKEQIESEILGMF